jgi:hypothetical protein
MYAVLAFPVKILLAIVGLITTFIDFLNSRKEKEVPNNTPEFERWLDKLEQIREEKVEQIREKDPEMAVVFDKKTQKIMVQKRKKSDG